MNDLPACLSDEAVRQLVRGDFAEEALAEARAHAASCTSCAERVHELRAGSGALAERGSTREQGRDTRAAGSGPSIEGYQVLHEMHRGAQGVVYRAVQASTGREVALKVLHAPQGESARRRFEREMDIASTLRHPNVVTVHDGGASTEQCFLAMELIEGENVVEHVARRKLGVRETMALFAEACAGVAHAQQRGIIHRDLKPSNVRVDALGRPRVLDFGLAKSLGADAELTATGAFVGTLAYASPEQLRGDAAAVDVRTDVYSLGALLYEMLTGQPPHALGDDLVQALRDVAETTVAAPSTLRKDVDGEVDTIVLEALAKDPERRYSGAEALRRDVERYLAGDAIEAKRDSSLYVLGKLVRRHRMMVGFTAVLLVLVTAATWAVLEERNRRLEEEGRAADAALAAERDAEAARSTAQLLQSLIGLSSPAKMDRPSISGQEIIDEVTSWIEDGMPRKPEIQGPLLVSLGRSMIEKHLHHDALAVLERAVEQQRAHLGDEHVDVAVAWSALGAARGYAADFAGAEDCYRSALRIRRSALGPQASETGQAQLGLALQLWRRGDAEAAEAMLLEIQQTFGDGRDPELVALALLRHANLEKSEDVQRSIALCREALEVLRTGGLPDSHRVELVLSGLSTYLSKAGEVEEALEHARELLRLRRTRLGEEDGAVGNAIHNVGLFEYKLGNYEEAEPLILEAIRNWERRGRPPGRHVYRPYGNLAGVYWMTGRLEEAEAAYEESLRLALEWWPEDSKYVRWTRRHLAKLRAEMDGSKQ